MLSACGRIAFDAALDASVRADDATADTGPPGLRLWLRMEDDPNDGVLDSAGGHQVECGLAGCPVLTPGMRGMAYVFDGTRMLRTPYTADLDGRNGFTIAGWVRIDAYPASYAGFIGQPFGAADRNSFAPCLRGATQQILFYSASASQEGYDYGPTLPLGVWRQFAMSWDGAIKRGYVDGVKQVEVAADIAFDDQDIHVAGDKTGGTENYFLQGALDEIMLFDRALADDEIAAL
jgi:hypothetical protein